TLARSGSNPSSVMSHSAGESASRTSCSRHRAVGARDLRVGLGAREVDLQSGARTALGTHRVAVLAGLHDVALEEVTERHARGEGVACAGGVDDVLHRYAWHDVLLQRAVAVEPVRHAAAL